MDPMGLGDPKSLSNTSELKRDPGPGTSSPLSMPHCILRDTELAGPEQLPPLGC